MTNEEFKKLCMSQFDHCYHIMTDREEQYGRKGDRLAQFKDVALARNTTPEDALMGMRAKHESSLEYMVRDLAEGKCALLLLWEEKITDSINYLLLLRALIAERYGVHKELIKSREERPAIIKQLKECECICNNPNLTTHNKVEPPEAWKCLPRAMESNDGE